MKTTQKSPIRSFVFRQVLAGKTLRPCNLAICFEADNVVAYRTALDGHGSRTQELTRFRDNRFSSQPAEYSATNRTAAIAQFTRDFPKMKVTG